MALATLTSTVAGISVESAEPEARVNNRVARFGVQDRTTTVFVYVDVLQQENHLVIGVLGRVKWS